MATIPISPQPLWSTKPKPLSLPFTSLPLPKRLLCHSSDRLRGVVEAFDPSVPLSRATTPPSSWYTDPAFLDLEFDRVFFRGWQAVGFTEQVENPNDFFTGRLGNLQYVVCRDANGDLRAFHNVCRHRASLLASGSGKKACFVCPYHGWSYGLDGALLKATRITGIQNFDINEFGLIPLKVVTCGPFILVSSEKSVVKQHNLSREEVETEWFGSSSLILSMAGIDCSLKHICRREYIIDCNWKVFCDNYLDGGYHLPYAHADLASGVSMDSYCTEIFGKVSIQRCDTIAVEKPNDFNRLGSKASYVFVYPNFMINRYGPWMDTNLVVPLGPRKCQVIFDYFLDPSLKEDKTFITKSLDDSERVQFQDIELCEAAQKGLESPAYSNGRYVPSVEHALHHFHSLLHNSLTN